MSRSAGIADRQRGDLLRQRVDDLVVARTGREDPRLGRADLALEHRHAARDDPRYRLVDVHVVEHDRRGLAAQLERDPADVATAELGDALAHRGAAREAHLVDARVGDEPLALRHVGDEDVDDPGRQARLLDGLREDVAGQPVLHRRLEDHRAPRREGGRHLLRAQRQRPVERGDRDGHPDRLAQDQRACRRAQALLLERVRLAEVGVRPEVDRGHRRHVALGEGDRVPVLLHAELGELVASPIEVVGEPAQRGGPLGRRPARPLTVVERGPRGGHRSIDVRRACERHLADDLLRPGRRHVRPPAGLRGDETAVHEDAVVGPRTSAQLHGLSTSRLPEVTSVYPE